jgi:hypothetical protein
MKWPAPKVTLRHLGPGGVATPGGGQRTGAKINGRTPGPFTKIRGTKWISFLLGTFLSGKETFQYPILRHPV